MNADIARKGVIIILDGLGDRPNAKLNGLTPLEAANTPVMNGLVQRGRCGLVDPIAPDVRVGTHVGAGVLMGLAPTDVRAVGRGLVEAAGVELPIALGDVAMRCNFATLFERGNRLFVQDRRAGRISEDTTELLEALSTLSPSDGIRATVKAATGHRAVLRLSGEELSAAITDTDPGDAVALPNRVSSCEARSEDRAAQRTADAVNRFVRLSFEKLRNHPVNRQRIAQGLLPANGLITRSAGGYRTLKNHLRDQRIRAAVISAESTVLGLGRLSGFSLITEPRFTATTDTDLDAKIRATQAALAEHDLVYLHIKGTDICAHDRKPLEKRDFLEKIDAALGALVTNSLVLAITADHTTDSNTGSHTGDPVPTALFAPDAPPDSQQEFGESQCREGALPRQTSTSFLATVLEAMGHRTDRSAAGGIDTSRISTAAPCGPTES